MKETKKKKSAKKKKEPQSYKGCSDDEETVKSKYASRSEKRKFTKDPFNINKMYDSTEGSSTEKSKSPQENNEKSPPQTSQDDFARYTPIAALTSNTNDWIVKARVTKKYDRRNWNNARGRGYLMNIDLCDAFGS